MKKIITVALSILIFSTNCFAITEWTKSIPASGDNLTSWPTQSTGNLGNMDTLLANYRNGMLLTYSNASTISVSAGEVVVSKSDGSARYFRQNTSATNITSSNLDVAGSFSTSTTYYVYAKGDTSQTAAEFVISSSSSEPSGVTYYKKLGSFYVDSGGNISLINNYDGVQYGYYGTSPTSEGTCSAGSEYTNTTGKKLMVIAYASGVNSGGFQYIDLSGNIGATSASTEVTRYAVYDNNTTNTYYGNITFVVPVGWKWKVSINPIEGHSATLQRCESWQVN